MSRIAARIGTRYDGIINYFRRHPFGSIPQDMTTLSLLPPIDRVLILERIFSQRNGDMIATIDKLSMAYVKSGYEEIPFEFLTACLKSGLLSEDEYMFFVEKLRGLNVYGVSDDYNDTIKKLPNYVCEGDELGEELKSLCRDYREKEIFAGMSMLDPEEHVDRYEFDDERRGFIRSIAPKAKAGKPCRKDNGSPTTSLQSPNVTQNASPQIAPYDSWNMMVAPVEMPSMILQDQRSWMASDIRKGLMFDFELQEALGKVLRRKGVSEELFYRKIAAASMQLNVSTYELIDKLRMLQNNPAAMEEVVSAILTV